MRDIGKNIRQLRTQKNMTQDELAEKLFVTRQTVSNYETGRSRPDVEMLAKIAEVLETDANTVLYGPAPAPDRTSLVILLICCAAAIALFLLRQISYPYARQYSARNFSIFPTVLILGLLDPLVWLLASWTLTKMLTMAVKKGPFKGRYLPYLRRGLALLLALWLIILIPYLTVFALDDYLYGEKLRGEWVEETYGRSWKHIPLPTLEVLEVPGVPVLQFLLQYPWATGILGIMLCLCGFPGEKSGINDRLSHQA